METMAGHLHKVTFKEQLIICNAVRQHTDELKYAHLTPALLPFIPLELARDSLRYVTNSRPIAVITAKLKASYSESNTAIYLFKKHKVTRVFGTQPEKGRIFNWLPTIKDVSKRVALKPERGHWKGERGRFRLVVAKEYREAVALWCIDNLN